MRRDGIEQFPRPGDDSVVVGSVTPAAVDVHDEVGLATRVGGLLHSDAAHRAAELSDEHFAFRRRDAAGGIGHGVQELVGQLGKVVGLPVVARTRLEQRIEDLLERRERHGAEMLAYRCAQSAERRHVIHGGRGIAMMDERQDDDMGAMHLFGQERQRRRLAQNRPYAQLLRHSRERGAPFA